MNEILLDCPVPVVVDLLFNVLPIVCWGSVFVFFLLCITLCLLFALFLLPYIRLVTVIVLWLFIRVAWVGLQCVIVVLFPDHTYFFKSVILSTFKVCVFQKEIHVLC